jgi:tRNA 2-thiouridine synthesizing protein E
MTMQPQAAIPARALETLGPAFDEDGFLLDAAQWTETLAEQLAEAAEVHPLTAGHWQTIRYVRDKYLRLGAMPPMRQVCRQIGVNRDEIKHRFGGCRQLWQIAGLPNPGEEAKAYMD